MQIPSGLSGEEIPISSRIVAVADAYDKLTNNNYSQVKDMALKQLLLGADSTFDPQVVRAFVNLFEKNSNFPAL